VAGYQVYFVHLVRLVQPNRPNEQEKPPAFHAIRLVALADVFSILLDVMTRLARNKQTGAIQPGAIECRYDKNPTVPGGWDFKVAWKRGTSGKVIVSSEF
jgi:hypothetical protein